MKVPASPDRSAKGLTAETPDALRYENISDEPREVTSLMRAIMPGGVRVLDIGCGTGSVTALANRGKGNTVVGIEPDPERCAMARARGIDAHNQLLDRDFFTRHGLFDVISFADVLEHLPAPADVMDLALEGLRPGGLVIVSVPNVAHWSVRLKLLFGRFDYEDVGICDSTHLRWFTASTIRSFLEGCGLEILSQDATAGATLPIYYRSPLRFVPGRVKRPVVRALSRMLPRLFGCQHILSARKPLR